MPAIDTIASFQTTVGSTLAAGVMATGDSATIRNFPQPGNAKLIAAMYDDVTAPAVWRVRSPLLHDNVRGIQFWPGIAGAQELLLPTRYTQSLKAQDTLTFEFTTAATTGKALGALSVYYSSLPGASARLHLPGDIGGLIKNIKPLVVTIPSGANTAGQWYDALWTLTENLLHANTDYAVLGFTVDAAVAAIAVKGIDTGNLRVAGPGTLSNHLTIDWFVRLSEHTGMPCIPVVNSANAGGAYVSIISSAATAAACDVTLILAELSQNLPN